jgi:hypothetical protein
MKIIARMANGWKWPCRSPIAAKYADFARQTHGKTLTNQGNTGLLYDPPLKHLRSF